MGTDVVKYEDLFGQNDFGFSILLPELPNDVLAKDIDYYNWIIRYVLLNAKARKPDRDTANSVFRKVLDLKCSKQLKDKMVTQMQSPRAKRLWCDVELAHAGYVSRLVLTTPTDHNRIAKKEIQVDKVATYCSSNSFCGPFGENGEHVIVLLPYYAEKALDELSYVAFHGTLRALNRHLKLNRLQVFLVALTVITTEYWEEDEEQIQHFIQKATSREADEQWAKLLLSEPDISPVYVHPSADQIKKLRTARNMILLPDCAWFRNLAKTFTFESFRMGVQIVNRGKPIDSKITISAWEAAVHHRHLNFKPKLTKEAKNELLAESRTPSNAQYFEVLQTMKQYLLVNYSLSSKSYLQPFRHTYMMIKVLKGDPGCVIPLAQPIWCDLPANLSFMVLVKILNPKKNVNRSFAQSLWWVITPVREAKHFREAAQIGDDMVREEISTAGIEELWENPPRPRRAARQVKKIEEDSSSTAATDASRAERTFSQKDGEAADIVTSKPTAAAGQTRGTGEQSSLTAVGDNRPKRAVVEKDSEDEEEDIVQPRKRFVGLITLLYTLLELIKYIAPAFPMIR
ncbi:MAG: hypothetical protein M1812_008450 [Candelaria pacifica]|nr:MAG: hypothetical protein M1812_008450 [Candelaria pacifica]